MRGIWVLCWHSCGCSVMPAPCRRKPSPASSPVARPRLQLLYAGVVEWRKFLLSSRNDCLGNVNVVRMHRETEDSALSFFESSCSGNGAKHVMSSYLISEYQAHKNACACARADLYLAGSRGHHSRGHARECALYIRSVDPALGIRIRMAAIRMGSVCIDARTIFGT